MNAFTIILATIISFTTLSASAQVGMTGNNPNQSAVLDLSGSSKGLLIPRINLLSATDVSTIATPAQSLLIYNTNPAVGVGFYYWDTNRWRKVIPTTDIAGDNLGNHTATANLRMGDSTISNTGTAGKGLAFDVAGNATLLQQVMLKNLPNAGTTEMVITADDNGLLKRGNINLSSIPRRTSYTGKPVAAGATDTITMAYNPTNAIYSVSTSSACDAAVTSFSSYTDVISYMSGQAKNVTYQATINDPNGGSLMLVIPGGVPPCPDGGDGTQFNFTVTKIGAMLLITNNGNVTRTYQVRQAEM